MTLDTDLLGGRYRILSPLGAGGMGEVFLAENTRLERRVAVKLLPASAGEDAIARERLRREALAAAALDHPFICKVFEIGDADGRFFIVMEYVEGETLHASSHRALLPLRQVIDIAHERAQALEAADRSRGRAMLEAALADFRTLEMVLHANLAEQWLRSSSASGLQSF
jgi:serine/threonine protein kinase